MHIGIEKYLKLALLGLVAALILSLPVEATIVAPSATRFADLFATPARTFLAFSSVPFTASVRTYSGILKATVYLDATPLVGVCPAGGCLDFYYQVVNNAGSRDSISRESNINFGGFITSASFRINGASPVAGSAAFPNGTVTPITADRDALGNVGGPALLHI